MTMPAKLLELKPSYPKMENGWFKPAFTPAEMLEAGVFGGFYFYIALAEDLEGLDDKVLALVDQNKRAKPSWASNFFGVKAGLDHAWWVQKGLIFPEDPIGWFHWYCRYYNGRRHERDLHQIARHQNFKRWMSTGTDQYRTKGFVSPVVMQSLLQWAWNPQECFTDGKPQNLPHPMPIGERSD